MYLWFIGVDPAGKGRASAGPCSPTSTPARTSSASPPTWRPGTPDNVAYYARDGYAQLGEIGMPNGPPHVADGAPAPASGEAAAGRRPQPPRVEVHLRPGEPHHGVARRLELRLAPASAASWAAVWWAPRPSSSTISRASRQSMSAGSGRSARSARGAVGGSARRAARSRARDRWRSGRAGGGGLHGGAERPVPARPLREDGLEHVQESSARTRRGRGRGEGSCGSGPSAAARSACGSGTTGSPR